MKALTIPVVIGVVVLAGCGSKRPRPAGEYYAAASESFRNGALERAIEEFNELLDQHPFSEHSEEAELKIAHAHYLAGAYPEAIVALSDFQRRHPTSPHLPFVGYYLGMCYVRQMKSLDRDQTAARNAHTYFLMVSRQYPDSPFAELARERLAECRERLAAHELYVARFYRKNENHRAAEARLLNLAARYDGTQAAAEALLELGDLYRAQTRPDHAALAYAAAIAADPDGTKARRAGRELERLASGADAPSPEASLDALLAANGMRRKAPDVEPVRAIEPGTRGPRPGLAAMGPPGTGFGPTSGPFGSGPFGGRGPAF